MRRTIATVLAAVTAAGAAVFSQTSSRPRSLDGPAFDVVSIKPHPEDGPVSNVVYQRPDGGFSLTALPPSLLIARAYALTQANDIVGLPDWAEDELYDVSATSPLLQATTEDRLAMWRAMLADRFALVVHLEKRTRPAYELVLARRDGRLGPGLTRVAGDCERPCGLRVEPQGPDYHSILFTGDVTIAELVMSLQSGMRRLVVDKTGLSGSYRVRLIYEAVFPDSVPHLSAAVREQLGLRLRSSRAEQDTLVVDRIERPTAN